MSETGYLAGNWRRLRQPRFLVELLGRFAVAFMLLAALVTMALLGVDYERFVAQRGALTQMERGQMDAAAAVLEQELLQPLRAVETVASYATIRRALATPSAASDRQITEILQAALRFIGIFESVSILGASGVERLRIDWRDGAFRTAPGEALRDLSSRAEVQQASALAPGETYVGPLELDPGRNEAVIRLASPISGEDGRPAGYLLAAFRANDLLEYFRSVTVDSWGHPMLFGQSGSWLYGHGAGQNGEFTWSRVERFAERFPQASRAIGEAGSGAVLTDEGFFTYATFPAVGARRDATEAAQRPSWMLVTWVEPDVYHYPGASGVSVNLPLAVPLLLVVGLVSLLLAWLRSNNLAQSRELRLNEERLDLALQSTQEGLWDADLIGGRVHYSPRWKQILGYGPDQLSDSPQEWRSRLHPDDHDRILKWIAGQMAGEPVGQAPRCRLRHRDGRYIWVESHLRVLRNAGGQAVRLVGTIDDVSERVEAEDGLRQAAAVFENTNEAIVVIGTDHRIRVVNPAFTEITGYTAEEAIGRNPREILGSGRHDKAFFDERLATLKRSGEWKGEVWERHKDGHLFPVWQNVSVIRDDAGNIQRYVAVLTDISALKSSEQRLHELAHTDALTGLPNRLLLMANLEQALVRAERHRQRVALMFLDLDHFKGINDTLGHDAGDALLREVARRLRECIRAEDTVARLGGDEFTVVLEEVDQPGAFTGPADKIIEALARPMTLEGRTISTSTSIGISLYPDHATSTADLMKAADVAMYQAKQAGRGTYRLYTPEMSDVVSRRVAIEQGLRQALAAGELFLCYQPQFEFSEGRLVGLEALLRWRHPRYGVLPPDQFVPVAEDTGLIEPIGEWVLESVCAQGRRWHEAGAGPLRLAVNLAVRQLGSERFLDCLERSLRDFPCDSGMQLELEITESALQTAEDSIRSLGDLKSLGVRLAIDDFGTGFSSLSSLKHLPADTLKLDRSFVHDIPADPDSNAIAQAVVALGHGMHLNVLAEGVEDADQASYLRDLGCDEVQGFLYGRPVEPQEISRRFSDGGFARIAL